MKLLPEKLASSFCSEAVSFSVSGSYLPSELNTYSNLDILLQRQVQILGILVIAVGYNITNTTCSVFLSMFLQFLHF